MVRILIFLAVFLLGGCASVSRPYCSSSYSTCEIHHLNAEVDRGFVELDDD